jgi:hypothetical protein
VFRRYRQSIIGYYQVALELGCICLGYTDHIGELSAVCFAVQENSLLVLEIVTVLSCVQMGDGMCIVANETPKAMGLRRH